MIHAVARSIIKRVSRRVPDFIIGGHDRPYLKRWWALPRNRLFNVYIHQILRDDDDRAFHDHPWFWCSIILRGAYLEHSERGVREYRAGSIRFHLPWFAHRLALVDAAPCWTIFITLFRIREWGFKCPKGWIPWWRFVAPSDSGSVGQGCEG